MAWGCSHGDGWFLLLNALCWKIKGHIENHNRNVEWHEKWEQEAREKGKPIEPRPEWAKEKIKFKFEQIKEKFGSLRIYYSGGDDEIQGYIDMAEFTSAMVCEECGKFDTTVGRTTKGWIQSLCEDCHKKDDREREWDLFEHNEEIEKLLVEAKIYKEENKGKEIENAMKVVAEMRKRNETASS